jgi:hypothetical protein
MSDKPKPTVYEALKLIEEARMALERAVLGPSPEKSNAILKIDEAVLWLKEIRV